jgi:prepilin-type N-terminal cleavage/methylation domain-containing protein
MNASSHAVEMPGQSSDQGRTGFQPVPYRPGSLHQSIAPGDHATDEKCAGLSAVRDRLEACPTAVLRRRRKCRAFSLLEIMVAVALLAVIIVGLLAMFFQVQRAFRAGTSQVDVLEAGRGVMNFLPRELQQITATGLPVTNLAVIAAINATDTVELLPTGGERYNFLNDLCFLSRAGDVWTGTAYRFSNAVTGVGALYRLSSSITNDSHPDTNVMWLTNLSEFVCQATPYNTITGFRPVIDGVVHFSVLGYDIDGMVFTNWNGFKGNTPYVVNDSYTNNVLPAYLDIEMAVLRPDTFDKFKARLDPLAPFPQNILRATNYLAKQIGNTDVFRQRVVIRPAATDTGAARVTSFP